MERNGGKQPQPQQPEAAAAAAEKKAAWRDGAITYFHLLFYIAISGGQIFFNKASPSVQSSDPPRPPPFRIPFRFAAPRSCRPRRVPELATDLRLPIPDAVTRRDTYTVAHS